MPQWQPVTNLRTTLVQKPPVVVFLFCLLVLAGAFISVGLYSQNHDIKNPDINMDWNQMLGSLASLKFCTHVNSTEILSRKLEDDSPRLLDNGDGSITNASQRTKAALSLSVPLVRVGDEPNYNSISATLLGSQLGLKGAAGKELLNITLFFHQQTQLLGAQSASTFDLTNAEKKSKSSTTCLTVNAPAHLLPQTLSPQICPAINNLQKDMSPIRTTAVESYKQSSHNAPSCLSLKFTPDPKLTVLLTQEEKALARYHLMLVSIVLLAVCSMMCLTGTLTSRWHLAKNLHSQKETLLGS